MVECEELIRNKEKKGFVFFRFRQLGPVGALVFIWTIGHFLVGPHLSIWGE